MNTEKNSRSEEKIVQCPFCAGRYAVYEDCTYCGNAYYWVAEHADPATESGAGNHKVEQIE